MTPIRTGASLIVAGAMVLIIQVGHYAGWPTIALAATQFAEVLKEEEEGKGPSRHITSSFSVSLW